MTMTEKNRSESAGKPLNETIVERKSVKKVKLRIKPRTTPKGRAFPVFWPPIDDESTIGNIGKIHGLRTVTIPAKNANATSKIID